MTRCSISAFSTKHRADDQLGGAYQLWGSLLVSDLCIVNGAEKSASGFPSPHTGPIAAVWLQFKNGAEKVPNALALRGDSVSPLEPLDASRNPDFEKRNACHERSTRMKPYTHDESSGRVVDWKNLPTILIIYCQTFAGSSFLNVTFRCFSLKLTIVNDESLCRCHFVLLEIVTVH